MSQAMVCGVDCKTGDSNCNGYCTGKADSPKDATPEIVLSRSRRRLEKAALDLEAAYRDLSGLIVKVPSTDAELLHDCLNILQYATYHDGRYGQGSNYEKFIKPAFGLVKRLADRLGVDTYEGYGG